MLRGYEIITVEDGTEAINEYRKAKKEVKPYDVVILDLIIPGGMGGKETMEKLLEEDSNAKVIASSGYSDDPIMVHWQEYGFKGVLSKPYSTEELEKTIIDVLNTPSIIHTPTMKEDSAIS